MATRIVDVHGEPFETDEVRRRMGFMGGDLLRDHDTASSVTPPERTYTIGPDDDGPRRTMPERWLASAKGRRAG